MAGESGAWRCGGCCGGKTNGEILGECEERVREMGGGEEVVVPQELRMGWRDEMGKKKKEGGEGDEGGEDGESARLAEGFVQTAPVAGPSSASSGGRETTTSRGTAVPPTARPAPPSNPPAPALQQIAAQRVSNDVWLDRLIIALAVLLAAVVAKVMLA